MSGRLKEEIKQTKPFTSLRGEAVLNVLRTADQFTRAISEALKPADISPTQYNVLRILRGAGKDGWTCSEIGERMVTRDPDITRLLDRLEDRGLVERDRSEEDRRVVNVRITQKGTKILSEIEPMLKHVDQSLVGHLSEERVKLLIELLEEVRDRSR